MIEQISNKITNLLLQAELLEETAIPTFKYCFEVVFMLFLFLFLTFPVAYILGFFLPSLLFVILFLLLRSVAGGFHAKNPELCLLLSVGSFFLFLLVCNFYTSNYFTIIIYGIACLIILVKAPIEAKNYPLAQHKKERHKKQCKILLVAFSLIYAYCHIYKMYSFASSIFMAVLSISIALLITK